MSRKITVKDMQNFFIVNLFGILFLLMGLWFLYYCHFDSSNAELIMVVFYYLVGTCFTISSFYIFYLGFASILKEDLKSIGGRKR